MNNLIYTDLNNICNIKKSRFNRKSTDINDNGLYNFYAGGIKKSNFNDKTEMTILINIHKSKNNIYIDENFSCINNFYLLLNIKNNESFNLRFIYYYIKLIINFESLYCNNPLLQWLLLDKINSIQIPIIDYTHQLEIVDILDEYFYIFDINEFYSNNYNNIIFNLLLNKEYEKLYIIKNNERIYLHPKYIIINNNNIFEYNNIYKLHDWIDINKLNFTKLSKNINAIKILKKKRHKINWYVLSGNINAIKLLEENQDKINWDVLSGNINAMKLLKENQDKIDWKVLSGNINAMRLLEENQDKINWDVLSGNINAIKLLEENQDKIDWNVLIYNINAKEILKKKIETSNFRDHGIMLMNLCANIDTMEILTQNYDKINWTGLSHNKNAIKLLEENQDKINWFALSGNINAIKLLEENQDKIAWYMLSHNINAIKLLEEKKDKIDWQQLSHNINAIKLLEENQDKINWTTLSGNINAIKLLEENQDKIDWDILTDNINIFTIDYDFLKKRMLHGFGSELMENRFNPINFIKFHDWGFDDECEFDE